MFTTDLNRSSDAPILQKRNFSAKPNFTLSKKTIPITLAKNSPDIEKPQIENQQHLIKQKAFQEIEQKNALANKIEEAKMKLNEIQENNKMLTTKIMNGTTLKKRLNEAYQKMSRYDKMGEKERKKVLKVH